MGSGIASIVPSGESNKALKLVYAESSSSKRSITYTLTKSGPVIVVLDLAYTKCNPALNLDGVAQTGVELASYYRIQHTADWHEDWTGYSTSYTFYAKKGQTIDLSWKTGQPSVRIFART